MSSALSITLLVVFLSVGAPLAIYLGILGLLIAFPSLQAYVVYLHKARLTGSKNLNVPEQFRFLHNQVTPFYIDTEDGVKLHTWHILPLDVYDQTQEDVLNQDLSGPVEDIASTLNFRLLRDDPEAKLAMCMHGTSGTIGSTIRPSSYRNLCSAPLNKTHRLAFDYRGFGLSSGSPSEHDLLLDALAVVRWATTTAQVPPYQIVTYGQSLGSAVSVALINYLAKQHPSLPFAGVIISASFADLASLTATYRIGGVIPVLAPISKIRPLFRFFTSRLKDTWIVKDYLAEFVRNSKNHRLALVHSEDDCDIPVAHSQQLFWHAVKASSATSVSFAELKKYKGRNKVDFGPGGWYVDWTTEKGSIRLQVLKHGQHDWQMTYPATALALVRAFRSRQPVHGV
jgi:abhydrolase domain-containing protein 12